MEASKSELVDAILSIAQLFKIKKNYRAVLDSYTSLPKIVEMIIYDMFVYNFDKNNCTEEHLKNYELIHRYSTELREKGYVSFNGNK